VPLYLAPKLALYLAMREHGTRNTELAKRLGVSETVVRRMLDPKTWHKTGEDSGCTGGARQANRP